MLRRFFKSSPPERNPNNLGELFLMAATLAVSITVGHLYIEEKETHSCLTDDWRAAITISHNRACLGPYDEPYPWYSSQFFAEI